MMLLKRRSAVRVFAWVILSSDYRLELQVQWIQCQPIASMGLLKGLTRLLNGTLNS